MSRLLPAPAGPSPAAPAPTLPAPVVPVMPAPVASWEPEVLAEVWATPAPHYAVAYPAVGGGWHISLLEEGGAVREVFTAAGLDAADHELQERGYLSLASAMCRDWAPLTPRRNEQGRGTPVFQDPGEDV